MFYHPVSCSTRSTLYELCKCWNPQYYRAHFSETIDLRIGHICLVFSGEMIRVVNPDLNRFLWYFYHKCVLKPSTIIWKLLWLVVWDCYRTVVRGSTGGLQVLFVSLTKGPECFPYLSPYQMPRNVCIGNHQNRAPLFLRHRVNVLRGHHA